jgi:hypothetical protein
LDIIFAIDGTASLDSANFTLQLQFVYNVVAAFDASLTHVSVIQMGQFAWTHFPLQAANLTAICFSSDCPRCIPCDIPSHQTGVIEGLTQADCDALGSPTCDDTLVYNTLACDWGNDNCCTDGSGLNNNYCFNPISPNVLHYGYYPIVYDASNACCSQTTCGGNSEVCPDESSCACCYEHGSSTVSATSSMNVLKN